MRPNPLTGALPVLVPPLTGAWERASLRDSAGTILQPPAPAAFAIYSANGFFSQTAIPTGRATIDKPLTEMTKEELLARFQRVSAMRGTCTVSGNRLTRKSLSSINPAQEGNELVQLFRIVGDTLILSSPNSASRTEAAGSRCFRPGADRCSSARFARMAVSSHTSSVRRGSPVTGARCISPGG